jgi:RNA polymerase sigma-70 factor (ECF subfamily)
MTVAIGSMTQVLPDVQSVRAEEVAHDHAWIRKLIKREGPGIMRMLWRMLQRESDVLDAYQDCFCKLASLDARKDLKSARAYAYRTAMNVAIEMIRVRVRHRAHLPAVAAERGEVAADRAAFGAEGAAPEADAGRFDRLSEAIAELPNHLRNVIVLRDLNRMEYADVGKTLGIDPATARVYRRHAVVRLAGLLGTGEG